MTVLIVILIIAAIYLVFIAAPSVVAYLTIFTRMHGTPVDEFRAEGTQFEPFMDAIREGRDYIMSQNTKEVSIKSGDGVTLGGLYADMGMPKTAIFCHGYRSSYMMNFAVQGKAFAEAGYNLLFIYERAHDGSEGDHSTLGILEGEDILLWADFAAALPGTERIVIYGMSMGGAATAMVSDRLDGSKVRALVIDCGFTSAYAQLDWDCRKRHLPRTLMMPLISALARSFLKIDISRPASDALKKTKIPAFFIHGTEDTTVPYEQGLENYNACASVKEMFTAEGAAHTVGYLSGGEEVKRSLFNFLDKTVDTFQEDIK